MSRWISTESADVASVKRDEAGAHNRKSRWCSIAAGNQISATPTASHGASESTLPDSSHLVRSSGRSRDPTCIFLLRGARPWSLAYPRRNYILRQSFCSAARAPARRIRDPYVSCEERVVVSGRDVYAGSGNVKEKWFESRGARRR